MLARRLLNVDGGTQDPYWDNVVLCLNAKGFNGSNIIVDEKGKTPTIYGETKVDTTLEYNTIKLDGNGDYFKFAPDGTAFNFGTNWCIEAWLRLNAIYGNLFTQRTSGVCQGILFGFHNNTVSLAMGDGAPTWFYAPSNFNLGVSASTLFHIAAVRNGSSIKCYRNGTEIHSGETSGVVTPGLGANIGYDPGNPGATPSYYPLNGYIKGLRVTNGVSRYADGFSPDQCPFPTI